MTDTYRPPSSRVIAVAVLAAVLVVAGAVLGLTTLSGASQGEGRCPAALEQMASTGPDAGARLHLLVDVPSDAPASAQRIAGDLLPALRRALEDGAFVSLVSDPGEGSPLAISRCFDGTRWFKVDYDNATRQEKELAGALAAASGHVEQFVRESEVAPTGSVLRLLQRASVDTATASGLVEVVVWSDFLSNARDCLNPDGAEANTDTISAIRERCAETRSLRPINGHVTLLGVGQTPRSAGFELWARDLAYVVCQALSPNCEIGLKERP